MKWFQSLNVDTIQLMSLSEKYFDQWLEWRDTISLMEEAYTKQSKTIEGYVKQIKELKQHRLQLEMIDNSK
jgi:hypothetical protein